MNIDKKNIVEPKILVRSNGTSQKNISFPVWKKTGNGIIFNYSSMKIALTRKLKLTIIFLCSQGTREEKYHKERVQRKKFVIVPVGRNFEDENTLQQKLVKMNCKDMFNKQAKTITEGTKINFSQWKQTGYSNQKEGYQINSGNFLGNISTTSWDLLWTLHVLMCYFAANVHSVCLFNVKLILVDFKVKLAF